jgi:hypothetical protein
MKLRCAVLPGIAVLMLGLARLSAADPVPVAEVDGRPITLRQVEDALLKQEGAELVQDFLANRLENMDWAGLADEDQLIQVGKVTLTRRQLADILLRKGAGPVREELVQIAIIDRALEREGIVVTDPVLDAALLRMERRFQSDSAAKLPAGQRLDFASWLRSTKRMSVVEFRASAGFRTLAGLQALVIKRAKAGLEEAAIDALFAKDPERFRIKEAIDVQVLFMPWRTTPGPGGTVIVPAGEQARLGEVASQVFGTIARGEVPFERAWTAFGKTWDPEAGHGGRVGWITRDGGRQQPGARTVPEDVVVRAWEVDRGYPALLPPIASSEGVWIVRILGRRADQAPALPAMREAVIDALIEDSLEERTSALLAELRTATPVKYLSLPGAVDQQRQSEPPKPP